MKKILLLPFILIFLGCSISSEEEKKSKNDSNSIKDGYSINKPIAETYRVKKQNQKKIELHDIDTIPTNYLLKAVVAKDSSITIFQNIRADYRIFGYQSPDTNSKKLVVFSVFTKDVEGNPYHCTYGAYYYSGAMIEMKMRYVKKVGGFIEANLVKEQNILSSLYFAQNWVEFD